MMHEFLMASHIGWIIRSIATGVGIVVSIQLFFIWTLGFFCQYIGTEWVELGRKRPNWQKALHEAALRGQRMRFRHDVGKNGRASCRLIKLQYPRLQSMCIVAPILLRYGPLVSATVDLQRYSGQNACQTCNPSQAAACAGGSRQMASS